MTFQRVFDVKNQPDAAQEAARGTRGRSRYQGRPRREDRDIHLLRLSLDLQLDAMLLTLGAAAAQEVDGEAEESVRGRPDPRIPWARWLTEDLELTRALTATAISVDAALPPTLGAAKGRKEPETMAGDLLARYESICSLLSDLIQDLPADGTSVWRASICHALARCRARVDELRQERESVQVANRPPAVEGHRYLPAVSPESA